MKRKRPSIILLALVLSLTLVQCQKPSYVLGRKKMTEVTKDMILTEAYLQQRYHPDSIAALYYEAVLERHGVSRAKYDTSLVWYAENGYRLADIYSQISSELTESKSLVDTFLSDSIHRHRIRFLRPETGGQGNSWSNGTRISIDASTATWAYTQTVSPNEPFGGGDTILWSASVLGKSPRPLNLRTQLLILDQNGYRYDKVDGNVSVGPKELQCHMALPDSLPEEPRYTFILLMTKAQEPVRLQRIYLGKSQPQIGPDGNP